jgi:hypothetical protein
MKVSTENNNNFGYEKITILVDNMPLSQNDHKNVRVGIFESKKYRVGRETLNTHIIFLA